MCRYSHPQNVASREVEEAIYLLDGVSEVAVVGLPHPVWVEAVTAVIVLKASVSVTEKPVVEHCAGRLAKFKCPKAVHFTATLPKKARVAKF